MNFDKENDQYREYLVFNQKYNLMLMVHIRHQVTSIYWGNLIS